MRSFPVANRLFGGGAFLSVVRRFPVAILAAALCALRVNLEVQEIVGPASDEPLRSFVALLGAAAIATACVLFCELRNVGGAARHLTSLVLAAAFGASLWYWDRLSVAFPALFAAAFAAIPLAPYAGRSSAGFWTFGWRLVYAAALAVAAVVLAGLGLSAIVASIGYLFGIEIGESVYEHVWVTGFSFVAPVLALSLVPASFPERDDPASDSILVASLRNLSDFLVVPLLAAYALLLHVYALKIVVETEVPRGQIGWMVLTFGLAALAVRVAVHALDGIARAPTRLFIRWWPTGLVVPLVLLLIALWQRVAAYGVTPERYALGLFSCFLLLLLAAQLFRRTRGDVRLIPGLAAALLFLASLGPWGMFAVSGRSQTERLKELLEGAGALQDGLLSEQPALTHAAALDVRSILDVLTTIGQGDRLRALLPEQLRRAATADEDELAWMWQAFNVERIPPERAGAFNFLPRASAVEVSGFDVVVPSLQTWGSDLTVVTLENPLPIVRASRTDPLIELEIQGTRSPITSAMLRPAFEARNADLSQEDAAPLFIDIDLTGRRVGILVERAVGELSEESLKLDGLSFQLFLRRSDWIAESGGDAGGLPDP